MADINNVTLTGRLARDPEIKTGGSYDRSWTSAKFTLAVGGTKRKGEDKADVDWVYCEAWNGTAELLQKYCHKGDRLGVTGKIKTNTIDKNGEKRTYMDVRVDTIHFLGSKGDNSGGGSTAPNDGYNCYTSTAANDTRAYAEADYQQRLNASLRNEIDPFLNDSPLDMDALGGMDADLPF